MRHKLSIPLCAAALMLAAPSAASAAFIHVIAAGESLSSVAAADGLSVAQLAAANSLPADAQLIAGSTLNIPPQTASATYVSTTAAAPSTSASSAGDGDADADDGVVSDNATTSSGTAGSYVVQAGDTLTAIAARAGISVAALAAANGIDPNAPLLAGVALRLQGAGSAPSSVAVSTAATSQPVGAAAEGSASGPPYPTAESVTASQVGSIANANGVSPSLAEAIGWQESGFNNDLVSSAGARGVMQILPGTWDWIQRTLTAGTPLAPASAADNVRGGVLLLHSLLAATGGDPAMAAAGYYQGLPSVQQHGLYGDTQQYVNSVMALRQRFGGG
jgi:LysM repeat protein